MDQPITFCMSIPFFACEHLLLKQEADLCGMACMYRRVAVDEVEMVAEVLSWTMADTRGRNRPRRKKL